LDDVVKPLSLGMPHLGALSYLVEHSKVFFFVFGSTSSPPLPPATPSCDFQCQQGAKEVTRAKGQQRRTKRFRNWKNGM